MPSPCTPTLHRAKRQQQPQQEGQPRSPASAEKAVRFEVRGTAQPSATRRRTFPRVPTPHPRDFARQMIVEEEEEEEGKKDRGCFTG